MAPLTLSGRRLVVTLLDLVIIVSTLVLAFLFRFDFTLSHPDFSDLLPAAQISLVAYFGAFHVCGLYRGIYYYSSFSDLLNITKGVFFGGLLSAAGVLFVLQGHYPRSLLVMHPILAFLGVCWIRFGIRLGKTYWNMPRVYTGEEKNVLLVGAGELGESLLRQINKTPDMKYRVVGFIDDDPAKWGMRVHGLPVFGGRGDIRAVLNHKQVDEIIIAISTRRGEIVRAVMDVLADMEDRPELKIAPALDEMLRSPGQGMAVRQVKPADLLNRDVVRLDSARIAHFLENKVVLVTGAGGSIGGELTRQVLGFKPSAILLLESHATSLFYMEAELKKAARATRIVPILGDIRDQALIDRVFNEFKPQVVLHAAAHKHVHQLEKNVAEGVGNNILGTYYLCQAAKKHECEAFLLISTDKAVRPSSVMGATKRVAEMVVRTFAKDRGRTRFVAVRFGNVLGSSGSVLEIFHKQIAEGGPITVTHPEVTRYFMTIPEAVSLILQAAAMAGGGEIFVLKMGTPVKIYEMAKNLLLLSGLEPGRDIEIKVTGLKPGEKMDEELVEDPTHVVDSQHPSIMVLKPEAAQGIDEKIIMDLEIISRTAPPESLVRMLKGLVPTFNPDAAHGVGA